MLKPHAHRPDVLARGDAAWRAPSLYDESLRLLARRGLPVPASHVQREWTQPYLASSEVEQAWLVAYRQPQTHWELYQLGEELPDLEDAFRLWRFGHVTTVERVIGFKRGAGGVSELRKMLDVVLFSEIWTLRTQLQPKPAEPEPNSPLNHWNRIGAVHAIWFRCSVANVRNASWHCCASRLASQSVSRAPHRRLQ
jgi:hypothetical protein